MAFGAAALALLILTPCLFQPVDVTGNPGLCLPAPNLWHLGRAGGWLLNTLLILLSTALIAAANKKLNFVPEDYSALSLGMLLLLACNPVTTFTLSTSTLLLLCNVLSLYIIFSTYEARNATREFFIAGTLPAIGAMCQYAFLVMIPVYIGAGLLMKSFRIKELIAFFFGLAAPYWILIGLGIVSPMDFRLPDSLSVINRGDVGEELFFSLLETGIMALIGCILALYNGVRLFSRNSRLRCIHMSLNFMGFLSVAAVIFDFSNFPAYFGSIALWLAVEVALLLHLYEIRRPQIAMLILYLVFIPLFILAL